MMLLFSIVVLIVGLIMLLNPTAWWQITEEWKSYSASEPSAFYIKITRIGGGIPTAAGIAGVILFFVL